jgi:hypothetical protein
MVDLAEFKQKFIGQSKERRILKFFALYILFVFSVPYVGNKRHLSGALYCDSQHSLMLAARTRHALGYYLAFFRNVFFELGNILVIYFLHLVGAERANLFAGGTTRGTFYFLFTHFRSPFS